jgi:hypothetical protein
MLMIRHSLRSLILALVLAAGAAPALAQGTAFTYQGELQSSGTPVNSPADFEFRLFTTATGGAQLGTSVVRTGVSVTSGLFNTPVDFGVNPYTSNQSLFLEIAVRNPAGSGSFVTLGSRQALTPAPFSLATRGLNVNAAGDLSLLTGADRRINVPSTPLNANGTNLIVTAGEANTSGNAADGGDLILEAGRARNFDQSFIRPGDVIIRSGGNRVNSSNAPNGGDIIFQSGAAFSANAERMRIASTGNVGINAAPTLSKLTIASDNAQFPAPAISVNPTHPTSKQTAISVGNWATVQDFNGTGGLNFSIYQRDVDQQRMFFSPTGNVGIGNTAPANRLSVSGNADFTGNVGIGTVSPIARLEMQGPVSGVNDTTALVRMFNCGAACAQEDFTEGLRLLNESPLGRMGLGFLTGGSTTINTVPSVWIGTNNGSDPGDGSNDFVVATKTNATTLTPRMTVNGDNGNVGIGTDAPAARLHNVGTTRIDDALQFGVQNFTGTAGSNARIYRFGAGGNGSNLYLDMTSTTGSSFIFQANGVDRFFFDIGTGGAFKPGGGAWGVLSDERSKNDIQPMTGTLDRLLQLKGHAYTYKPEFVENGRALPGMQIGLVAQEVETVFPDWVTTGADGLKQVTERSTTALMVEALRDLRSEKDAQIAQRDAELASLKARMEKLEAMLTAQIAANPAK